PEVFVGDGRKHVVPDRGRIGEIGPAWPLVVAEDHRAVLDRDPHAALGRMSDQRWPDLLEALEVLRVRAILVVAGKGADGVDAKALRRVDDLQQMAVHRLAVTVVGMEVVRVVRERRDLEPVLPERLVYLVRIEGLDVDVRHARVAARLAATGRPARDLERLEALGCGPGGDLGEREIREGGGQKAELHVGTFSHRPSAALRATASLITFSRRPAAKLGNSGSAGIPPLATAP